MVRKFRSQRKLSRQELKEVLYRRRYLVPNLVTVGSLFFGFLGIIYSVSNRFNKAPYAVLASIILDGLDGRLARRLNATSKFGGELDSFSDLVALGVAPAIMMYHWCFRAGADEFGVLICFIFVLCTALRLARFNVSEENLVRFEGIPTPGSAGMVIATVNAMEWSVDDPFFMAGTIHNMILIGFCTVLMLSLSYLMISKIEFPSIKKMKVRDMGVPAKVWLAALMFLIWYRPRLGWFILAMVYLSSGFVVLWKSRSQRKLVTSPEELSTEESESGVETA